MSKRVLIIAGEISGDMHAAKLVREIKALDPGVTFYANSINSFTANFGASAFSHAVPAGFAPFD